LFGGSRELTGTQQDAFPGIEHQMAVSNLDAIARRALTRHLRSSACAAADFNDVTLALLLVVLETQQV